MRMAIAEAKKALGRTSPNPIVGAVLVDGAKILGRGFHRQAGAAHAELVCLRAAGPVLPRSATLYVTLEPCSTKGRTGSCVDAIIRSGIKHVVVGAIDPNPLHNGRGLDRLEKAGVKIDRILEDECAALNQAFNKWIVTRMPWVIAKCGMSLDGHLTRPPGESQWLTSPAARRHARGLRSQVDAVLIGAETLRRDNPRLTVRPAPLSPQPWRVVITRSGKLPRDARMFTDALAGRTVVLQSGSLRSILRELGARDITSVLIEGGGDVLSQANDLRLIDKLQVYVAPLLTGGPTLAFGGRGAASTLRAARLRNVKYDRIDNILIVSGDVEYPARGPNVSSAVGLL